MTRRTIPIISHHALELRRNQTETEDKLWRALRKHQVAKVHFRRQHAIGPYIVDFCAPRKKLIIELDGGQHHEQKDYDQERTTYLVSQGYRVLRFWNHQVEENIESVVQTIFSSIQERH